MSSLVHGFIQMLIVLLL
jgi:3-oxoacyl-[acyl-carrier protein] reductase